MEIYIGMKVTLKNDFRLSIKKIIPADDYIFTVCGGIPALMKNELQGYTFNATQWELIKKNLL